MSVFQYGRRRSPSLASISPFSNVPLRSYPEVSFAGFFKVLTERQTRSTTMGGQGCRYFRKAFRVGSRPSFPSPGADGDGWSPRRRYEGCCGWEVWRGALATKDGRGQVVAWGPRRDAGPFRGRGTADPSGSGRDQFNAQAGSEAAGGSRGG